MGKPTVLLNTFNSWTGRSKRHNLALRDVTDWIVSIQEFLEKYNLQEGSSDFGSVFENIGEAKFTLTNITHRARLITKIAKNVKGARIPLLIEEILNELDAFRRALINPSVGRMVIGKVVPKLQESFKKLQDVISDIEYK